MAELADVLILLTVIVLVLIAAVIASLTVRRHGESATPKPGWTPTDELFKDPGTDRMMRVWLDRSGGRHYVPDART